MENEATKDKVQNTPETELTKAKVPVFEIEKEIIVLWGGIPGKQLKFYVTLALSGDMAKERERFINLKDEEKEAEKLDYRTRVLASVLLRDPENFPDFPTGSPETLRERALEYFSQETPDGRRIFRLVIEDFATQFWAWAMPFPFFPG